MNFFVIQFLGLIQLLVCVGAIFQKEKRKLLLLFSCSNICSIFICFLGHSIAGAALASISLLRTIIYYIYTNKNKKIPLLIFLTFTFIYIGATIATYNKWNDLIMLFSSIVATYITYQPNMKILRIGYLFESSSLIIFNLTIKAFVSMLSETIFVISTISSIIKYDIVGRGTNE